MCGILRSLARCVNPVPYPPRGRVKRHRSPSWAWVNRVGIPRTLLGAAIVIALAGCRSSSEAAFATGAVPAGFQPVSFTAVSERDFWLLGTVPCHGGRCTAIVRTTDGGRS